MRMLKKISLFYTNPKVQYGIGFFIIIFFTISYLLLTLNKYWQFEYFSVDNVYFDTALWKVAHGMAPLVRHPILGMINILGDHFHPTIFIFSLLYRIFPYREIIFLGMSVAYGVSAVFAMLTSFKLIKSRFITYALLLAYFLYIGTGNAMIYGFHEVNLVPLFFFMTIYGVFFEKRIFYWISFGLLLLTKESLAPLGCMLGLFLLVSIKGKRITGLITIGVSIVYYFLATHVFIPYFSKEFLYSHIDTTTDIHAIITRLTVPPEKIQTFWVSMASFGWLPLFSLAAVPMVLQDLIIRYLFALIGNVQYTLWFHYNIGLAPLLFFASIWAIVLLQKIKKLHTYLFLIGIWVILSTLYFFHFYSLKSPLWLVYNKTFYQVTKNNQFLWTLVNKTPIDGGRIMTENNLAYPLDRSDVYLLENDPKKLAAIDPKYIVFDDRPGQNPNNFFPLTQEQAYAFFTLLKTNPKYHTYFHQGSLYIFAKQ